MSRKALVFATTVVAVSMVLITTESRADRLKYYPASALQRLCHTNNGTFLPPTSGTGAYGCVKSDGGIIVCGGPRKWSKRCDSYSFLTIRGVRKHYGGGLLSR
jgi:hypothetical protein